MQDKMVSVILPVYNAEKYIEECINSVRKQMYSEWELIIIDDGSVDGTSKIINTFLKDERRIKYYKTENGGVSNARNYGLNLAKGEWIFFLDADDYLTENCLQDCVQTSVTYDADVVVIAHYELDEFSNTCKKNNKFKETEILNHNDTMKNFLKTNKIGWEIWGKLFRSNLLKNLNFDKELRIGEDAVYLVSTLKKCNKMVLLKEYGYFYRLNSTSVMAQKFSDKNLDTIEVISTIYEQTKSEYPIEADSFSLKYYIWFLRNFYCKVSAEERDSYKKCIDEIRNKICKVENRKAFQMLTHKYFIEFLGIKWFYKGYALFVKKVCK